MTDHAFAPPVQDAPSPSRLGLERARVVDPGDLQMLDVVPVDRSIWVSVE